MHRYGAFLIAIFQISPLHVYSFDALIPPGNCCVLLYSFRSRWSSSSPRCGTSVSSGTVGESSVSSSSVLLSSASSIPSSSSVTITDVSSSISDLDAFSLPTFSWLFPFCDVDSPLRERLGCHLYSGPLGYFHLRPLTLPCLWWLSMAFPQPFLTWVRSLVLPLLVLSRPVCRGVEDFNPCWNLISHVFRLPSPNIMVVFSIVIFFVLFAFWVFAFLPVFACFLTTLLVGLLSSHLEIALCLVPSTHLHVVISSRLRLLHDMPHCRF